MWRLSLLALIEDQYGYELVITKFYLFAYFSFFHQCFDSFQFRNQPLTFRKFELAFSLRFLIWVLMRNTTTPTVMLKCYHCYTIRLGGERWWLSSYIVSVIFPLLTSHLQMSKFWHCGWKNTWLDPNNAVLALFLSRTWISLTYLNFHRNENLFHN